MKVTGMWEKIEARLMENQPTKQTLADIYKNHFPNNTVNDEVIENIRRLEALGQTPAQIAEALHFPDEIVNILATDIPEIRQEEIEKEKEK